MSLVVNIVSPGATQKIRRIDDAIESGDPITTPPRWILLQNKWLAARYGLDAAIVIDEHGGRQILRDAIPALLEDLLPVATSLGCRDELAGVTELAAQVGDVALRDRGVAIETGVPYVVEDLLA